MNSRREGFTLIEILTVTAIISILAALIFPVFKSARLRAFLTQDLSQMRQTYQAINLYESDNNDISPMSLANIHDYTQENRVLLSPVDPYAKGIPRTADFPADLVVQGGPRVPYRISYAYAKPMIAAVGFQDDYWQEMRADPRLGMLANFFYNDVSPIQVAYGRPGYEWDLVREHRVVYRIRMDGSWAVHHRLPSEHIACSIADCFTLVP